MEKVIETKLGRHILKLYSDEYEEKVLSLWKTVFGKDMPLELWKWKYINGPFKYRILLCVNEQDDVVVFYGGIPFYAKLLGRRSEIIQLMDIMSHPDYRGSRLFGKTGDYFFECFGKPDSAHMLYGFPGGYHYKLGEKFLGYRRLYKDIMFCSGNTKNCGDRKTFSFYKISKITQVDDSFNSLWNRCSRYYSFSVIRDASFVKWRFIDHPTKDYEIWGLYSLPFPCLKAYAVFSIDQDKAVLVDVFAPASLKMIANFIKSISYAFYKREINKIETWLPSGHFISEALLMAGFTSQTEPLGIMSTVKLFDHSYDLQWISNNLYYTMADGDLF